MYDENENVDDVTLSEINSDEVPKEILTAVDSFNVESDEEFLGFE
jgi:hypothetical protein